MNVARLEAHMKREWVFHPNQSSEIVTYDDLSVAWDKVQLSYDGSNTTGP